jgi:hypothetical protein
MPYVPEWEPLTAALKRILGSGVEEDQAKSDLCHAIADDNIRVRVTISNNHKQERVYPRENVGIPKHLKSENIDWINSRPTSEWWIGPAPGQHYSWLDGKNEPIDLIEVATADVTDVFMLRAADMPSPGAGGHRLPKAPARKTTLAARLATELSNLFPAGRPAKKIEEIRRDLENLPRVGPFSPRTLDEALKQAWPKRADAGKIA